METQPTARVRETIGECAGEVWEFLHEHGPTNITKLLHNLGLSRDLIFQGIGWLAREGKLDISEDGRKKIVSLTG
jgi:predicted transcriptional regulator